MQYDAIQPVREAVEVWYQGSKFLGDQKVLDKVEALVLEYVVAETNKRLKALKGSRRADVVVRNGADSPRVVPAAGTAGVATEVKRGRGRPKGAKNKAKLAEEARIEAAMANEVPT